MRFQVLATDYDGTLAHHGRVDEPTLAALHRWRNDGRQLLLITGRRLPELVEVLPQLALFDLVVAENGGLLVEPQTGKELLLAEPPPADFLHHLRERGVDPLAVGRVVVATWQPHDRTIADVIRARNLPLQVILNKGAVMVLPQGVDKTSGLAAALDQLGVPAEAVVGVGDAENDQTFLEMCGYSVAVANALPELKARVDHVTERDHGAGVAELIDRLLAADHRPRDS